MPRKERTLSATLKALAVAFGGPENLDELRPLEQLILLILCQGSDVTKARSAMKRLQREYVDWNEIRVSGVYEIAGHLRVLGARKTLRKAQQIKELLTTVYNRFNKLNLDFLHASGADPELSRKKERFLTYLQDMLKAARAEAAKARRREAARKAARARNKAASAAKAKATKKAAKKKVKRKATATGTARKKASKTGLKTTKRKGGRRTFRMVAAPAQREGTE
jgi:hypothetical protein